MAITCSAPSMTALAIANWPTGTAPKTAMTSPPLMSHKSAPMKPVGEDVGEEQDLLVLEVVLDLDRADVGERHARVLGLAAGVAAGEVRVAEDAGRRVAEHLLRQARVRVGVLAQRVELIPAVPAVAARDREGDDDAVADLQAGHITAGLDDLAHELVAEDVALLHRRDVPVVEVQVGAADRGRADLDDRVAPVEDLGVRDVLDLDRVAAGPDCRAH